MSTKIIVTGKQLSFLGKTYPCAIGQNGTTSDKKEGDGGTPIGTFRLRECWYRIDRLEAPKTRLPTRIIRPEDGWCDDASHADYNKHITLPFDASHEELFRNDGIYDIIVPLGYNDDPAIPGKGSAIFLHIAQKDYEGTEGCVALACDDLLEVLAKCDAATTIEIT